MVMSMSLALEDGTEDLAVEECIFLLNIIPLGRTRSAKDLVVASRVSEGRRAGGVSVGGAGTGSLAEVAGGAGVQSRLEGLIRVAKASEDLASGLGLPMNVSSSSSVGVGKRGVTEEEGLGTLRGMTFPLCFLDTPVLATKPGA